MKPSVLCCLVLLFTSLRGEDPKVGASREEVIKLLGNPSGRIELRDGGTIFSFSRGDITFDKTKAIKVNLVSERQVEEAKKMELADRDAMAQRNAPGGQAYLEKKKQELVGLLAQFNASKTPGDRVTYYTHKSSACHMFSQYAPDGQRGLTVSFQVGSDSSLALYTRYIGYSAARYNQIGASFAQDDFISQLSKEITESPIANSDYEDVTTCTFRGQAIEEFILLIYANSGRQVTFTTYRNGRLVEPNIHPHQRVNNPTSYVLTDSDKRVLKKAVELSECLKALRDVKSGEGAAR